MTEEAKKYHEDTFEPVEETPAENIPAEDIPVEDSSEEVSPAESVEEAVSEQGTPPEEETPDNWQVRARYQQSEADKYKNVVQQQNQQIQALLEQIQPKKVDETPQEPSSDDPVEWVQYNAKMNKFILDRLGKQEQLSQEEKQRIEQQRIQAAQREFALAEMAKVTKSPEKSQKILDFFVDTRNFQDPALYNIMYDAAMSYINKKPSSVRTKINAPPPPVGGGEAVGGKKSPDDIFNEQLGQENRYRL